MWLFGFCVFLPSVYLQAVFWLTGNSLVHTQDVGTSESYASFKKHVCQCVTYQLTYKDSVELL